MKKLLTIFILCLVFSFCAVGFAACGGDNSEPEQGQSAQSDYLTKAQLSAGYKLVAKAAWAKLGFENVLEEETATTTFSAYSAALPETGVKLTEGTFNWAALRGNAGASVALINMIGDYYKNENFVITDKVVSFEIEDVFYSPSGEQVRTPSTLFIRPKIDVANKRVEIELRMKNEQYDNYYYFDLGFDFETETLNYFVFGLHVMGTYSMQKMDTNGDFYFANDGGADGEEMLPSAEFIAAVDRLEADFKTAIADGLTLTGNFQSEYDNFGTVSSKIFFESVNSVGDHGNGSGSGQGDTEPSADTKTLTKDEFLIWLEETQTNTFNDDSKHYATVSGTYVREGSGNYDGAYTGTFDLTYPTNMQGDGLAAATIKYSDSATYSMQVLGLNQQLARILALTETEGGDLEIKQVESNIDLQYELDYNGVLIIAHYTFDEDGYYLYSLTQQGDNKDEFTATSYNKA